MLKAEKIGRENCVVGRKRLEYAYQIVKDKMRWLCYPPPHETCSEGCDI